MGTFELVDTVKGEVYDQLPLQFVYKLMIWTTALTRLRSSRVVRGNLQYEHKYGDTHAPTAKLWTVRTLAALAAQEGMALKKFDLTGAFLVADMDSKL
jgi:hypothetical protein